MIKRFFIALVGLATVQTVQAACPEKPMSLCEIVKANPFVAHVRISSTQHLVDEDDLEGLAGWLYHLDVLRDYRGHHTAKRSAYSVNTAARLLLQTGKEYIVFASPDAEGNLETENRCDPYSETEYSLELEKQVNACLVKEKKQAKPNKKFQRTPTAPLN